MDHNDKKGNDQLKAIHAIWVARVGLSAAPETQKREMKKAFYAGAHTILSLLFSPNVNEEDLATLLEKLKEEASEHTKESKEILN